MAPKTASMVRRRTGPSGLRYPQRSRMTGRSPSLPGIQLDMDEIEIELSSQQATKKGGLPSMAAARAQPVQLQFVGLDGEPVSAGDFLVQAFDVAVFKFHDLPAGRADPASGVRVVGAGGVLRWRHDMARVG